MLESTFRASKLVEEIQEHFGYGQPLEGGCALVTVVASTPAIDPSRIPSLDQLDQGILTLRERRDGGLHARRKQSDTEELLARLSAGQARTIGSWSIKEGCGSFIDNVAANPGAVLRDLTDGPEAEEIFRTEKVTGLMIRKNYPGVEVGHVLSITPDDLAFNRNNRRRVQACKKKGIGCAHEMIDLSITAEDGIGGNPGIVIASGEEIVDYVTAEHPLNGKPRVYLHFVVTKR